MATRCKAGVATDTDSEVPHHGSGSRDGPMRLPAPIRRSSTVSPPIGAQASKQAAVADAASRPRNATQRNVSAATESERMLTKACDCVTN